MVPIAILSRPGEQGLADLIESWGSDMVGPDRALAARPERRPRRLPEREVIFRQATGPKPAMRRPETPIGPPQPPHSPGEEAVRELGRCSR
jgi:hypothetical protein